MKFGFTIIRNTIVSASSEVGFEGKQNTYSDKETKPLNVTVATSIMISTFCHCSQTIQTSHYALFNTVQHTL